MIVYFLYSCLAIQAQARIVCGQAQTANLVVIQMHELEEGFLNLTLNRAPSEMISVPEVARFKSIHGLPEGKSLYVQLESHDHLDQGYNRFVPSYKKTGDAYEIPLKNQTLMTSQGLFEKVDHFHFESIDSELHIVLQIDQMTYTRRLNSEPPRFRLAEASVISKAPVTDVTLRYKKESESFGGIPKHSIKLKHRISSEDAEDLAILKYRLLHNDEADTIYSNASTVRNGLTMVDPTINVSGGVQNQGLAKLMFAKAFQQHPEISQIRAILVWTNLDAALSDLIPKLQNEPQFQKPDPSLPWQMQYAQCCEMIPRSVVNQHLNAAIEKTPFYKSLAQFGFTRMSETYLAIDEKGRMHIGGTWDRVRPPAGWLRRLMDRLSDLIPST
jgi:hypothetical protein